MGPVAASCDPCNSDLVIDVLEPPESRTKQRDSPKYPKAALSKDGRLEQIVYVSGQVTCALAFAMIIAGMGLLLGKFVMLQLDVNDSYKSNNHTMTNAVYVNVKDRLGEDGSPENAVFLFNVESILKRLVNFEKSSPQDILSSPFQEKLVDQVPIAASVYLVHDENFIVIGLRFGCTAKLNTSIEWPIKGNISVSLLNNDNTVAQKWIEQFDTIGSCLDSLRYPVQRGFTSPLAYYVQDEFWKTGVLNGTIAYEFKILS